MNLDSLKNLLDVFGRSFIFERYREPLRQYFLKAGLERTPYGMFGMLFFVAVGITYGLFLGFFLPFLAQHNPVTKGFAALFFWVFVLSAIIFLISIAIVFALNLRIYARVRAMEAVLPEYLQLVVTNLKSGMNFEQSLWVAARPEFGVLSTEITLVSKQVLTGGDAADALREFSMRYDSPTLTRSFNLIIGEVRSGGKIVHVIERIIESLRKTRELKEEMAASVLSFIIFITVIVCVLTPVLFALANTLLAVMISFSSLLGNGLSGSSSMMGGSFAERLAGISKTGPAMKSLFITFSYWAIGLIAFSASLIISIIEKGDIRGGIKYVPVFTVVSLLMFLLCNSFFMTMFSSLVSVS